MLGSTSLRRNFDESMRDSPFWFLFRSRRLLLLNTARQKGAKDTCIACCVAKFVGFEHILVPLCVLLQSRSVRANENFRLFLIYWSFLFRAPQM